MQVVPQPSNDIPCFTIVPNKTATLGGTLIIHDYTCLSLHKASQIREVRYQLSDEIVTIPLIGRALINQYNLEHHDHPVSSTTAAVSLPLTAISELAFISACAFT